MTDDIIIDGMPIPARYGSPTVYYRPNGNTELAKIALDFRTGGEEAERIENLVSRTSVEVRDPFIEREYRAEIKKSIEHPTGGEDWERRYGLDVLELP